MNEKTLELKDLNISNILDSSIVGNSLLVEFPTLPSVFNSLKINSFYKYSIFSLKLNFQRQTLLKVSKPLLKSERFKLIRYMQLCVIDHAF